MSDQEMPKDGAEGAGTPKASSEGTVSMEQLNTAVENAVAKTIESVKPILEAASSEQTERLKQSQRDAIKDRVGSTVADALKEYGISTEAPAIPDSTSEPEPTDISAPKADEASQASDVIAGEMTKILEDAGLNGDEPEIKEWLAENKDKPWFQSGQSLFEVAQTLKGRADAAPIGGGEGGPSAPDDLVAKYVADRREIYTRMTKGEISHVQARDEGNAVKSAAKEAGVPVDQIGFGSPGSVARQNEYKGLS